MKLKLEKEVQDIINTIAQLPETSTEDKILWQPSVIIGNFDLSLIRQKEDKKLPMKQWVKLRRQLSFLYEVVLMSAEVGKKVSETDNDASKQESYRFMVKVFKKIADGTALDRPEFVRIGLNYGVVHLSDHEIQHLIANNKV